MCVSLGNLYPRVAQYCAWLYFRWKEGEEKESIKVEILGKWWEKAGDGAGNPQY